MLMLIFEEHGIIFLCLRHGLDMFCYVVSSPGPFAPIGSFCRIRVFRGHPDCEVLSGQHECMHLQIKLQKVEKNWGLRTFESSMLSVKTGHRKFRGYRGVPEKHDIQKDGTFAKFGGIRTFGTSMSSGKTGHSKISGVPRTPENAWKTRQTGHSKKTGVPGNSRK